MNKILNKPFCISILVIGFIYGLALPFFWGNNPASELGTLSLLCEDRKIWFWIWGILVVGGINVNTQYMYKKFGYSSRFLNVLCILSFVSICLVALTLGHSIADWNPKRVLHWIATGLFIALCMASVVLFFIINIKKHKHFGILTGCTVAILMTFAVIFIGVGKSALMEMIPLAMLQVMLFVINFTPAVKPQLPAEKIKVSAEK